MAGYKGYRLERRDRGKVVVSPLGVDIARFNYPAGRKLPFIGALEPGLSVRNDYETETEIVKDLADQHRRLEGDDDSDDQVLGCADARIVIKNTVTNYIQVNHNSLGVQMNGEQLQLQINDAVDNASPVTLKKVLKEWIPQAVVGGSVSVLLSMLGIGGG